MADYKVTDTELTSIANAIRAKTGKSAQIEFPTEFVSEIQGISSGGGATTVEGFVASLNGASDPIGNYSLVPYYTSSSDPSGYTLSYSYYAQNTTPAWAVFNSTITPVTNGGTSGVRWASNLAVPQWVQIKLPTAEKANAFYIATFKSSASGAASHCKTYKVQGSNDGTTFTDLYEETLDNLAIGKYIALPQESAEYLYYRVVVTESYDSTYSGLTSFFPMYIDLSQTGV